MTATKKEPQPRRGAGAKDYRNSMQQTALSVHTETCTRGVLMAKTHMILAGAASLGFAVIAVTIGPRFDRRTAAEVSHAIVAGVILGSGTWPYNLISGQLQPQLILGSADCEGQPQCPSRKID
jgi:hypothetical protein